LVNSSDGLTVALDITITDDLENEGLARELVNRLQNLRKQSDLNVTDRIRLSIVSQAKLDKAIRQFENYICTETLAEHLNLVSALDTSTSIDVNDMIVQIFIEKV